MAPSLLVSVAIAFLALALIRLSLADDHSWQVPLILVVGSVLIGAVAFGIRQPISNVSVLRYPIVAPACALAIAIILTVVSAIDDDDLSMVYCLFAAVIATTLWPDWRLFFIGLVCFLVPPVTLLIVTKPGIEQWTRSLQVMMFGVSAAIIVFVIVHTHNAQTQRLTAELVRRASYDGLTDVLVRSAWMARSSKIFVRDRQLDRPVSLLFIDIDNFKHVNDQLGHQTGDRILVSVAQVIRGQLKGDHVLGRFGGDEFVLLLSDTPHRSALEIKDRLHQAIPGVDVSPISVGIGTATSRVGGTLHDLIYRADLDMLEGKRARRPGLLV